jgi:Fe2+ transport system protein FeoA
MRLSEGIKSRGYKIVGLVGGRGARCRLLDLGLTIGVIIKVILIHSYGPVLIEVRGTRLAIGHGLAKKIMIAEIE